MPPNNMSLHHMKKTFFVFFVAVLPFYLTKFKSIKLARFDSLVPFFTQLNYSLLKFFIKKGLLLKPGPGPWTLNPDPEPCTLDPDPKKSGPWKTWTLKNLDPEKPGINIGLKNLYDFKELCFTKIIHNVSYCLKVRVLTDI